MPFILDPPTPSTVSRSPSIASTSPSIASTWPSSASQSDDEDRRGIHHETDVVIVGAGIVGCALAVALGNQGRTVTLLERSLKQPDRIVGELLQPGGIFALEKLGLRDCLQGIDAIPVQGYAVFYYDEEVDIKYPMNVGKADGTRPLGMSFHHGRFVNNLRKAAMRTPNVTVIESTVTSVVKNEWTGQVLGVGCTTKGEKDYYFAHLTVLCDGSASKFRKDFHTQIPQSSSKFYGIELQDAQLPYPQHGHVFLGDGSPVLLYQIGTHETRALVDVPDNTPTASAACGGIKNHLRNVVLPTLPERVQPSFDEAIEKGIRSMPNSYLPPTTNKTPGMILIGDAMNMRHPLTGGGMTVGLNDVVLVSDLLSPQRVPKLENTKQVMEQMASFHWQRKDITSVINVLAQALYALFAAKNSNLKALQLGCFSYFQIGGSCVDGPVGLLAGIIRSPLTLIYHFFAVALYAIWIKARQLPAFLLPASLMYYGVSLLLTAVQVIGPFLYNEIKS